MATYEVRFDGGVEPFDLYLDAVKRASAIGGEVYESENGKRRWHPAPKVSRERARMYRERKAAYEAQQRGK